MLLDGPDRASIDMGSIRSYCLVALTVATILVLMPAALHAQFAYVANYGPSYVSANRFDSTTGALTPVPGSPLPAGNHPVSVAVDPSSRFVYVANVDSNNVSGYTIDPTSLDYSRFC
jgi:6-phosphogluconolactonase (cycloisomerase 2 family)